jgi:acetoin utilization protein AcuB
MEVRMKSDESVSHLMSRDPVVLTTENKPSDARKLMQKHGVHHLPVVEDGRFIGLITANDLLRVAFGDTYKQDSRMVDALLDTMTIRDVMQEDVVTVQKDESISRAADLLADGSFHSLPVLDGETLVGVITSTDLIRKLLSGYAENGSDRA